MFPSPRKTIDCLEERGVEGEGEKKEKKEIVHNLPWKIEADRVTVNQTYLAAVSNAKPNREDTSKAGCSAH